MPWFMVDDGFHAHRKSVRAGVAALGLWVLAGSWSADQLTDGWVPDYMAARLDPQYEEHAAALVRAGLWSEDERDGDRGWLFHQWHERQLTSEEVLAKRAAARERMRRVRANKQRTSSEVRDGGAEGAANVFAGDADEMHRPSIKDGAAIAETWTQGGETGAVRANTSGTAREVRSTPAQPSPTSNQQETSSLVGGAGKPRAKKAKRGTRVPEPFDITEDMKAWKRANCPDVDGWPATEKFVDYWRGQPDGKGVKVDWVATWRNWMRREQENAARRPGNVVALRGDRPQGQSTADMRVAAAVALANRFAAEEQQS